MSRITITIDTEYIPDRFVGWPDVSIVLKCKPKDKYKAELVADLIAGMDCFDIGALTNYSPTNESKNSER